ncbi:MAG: IS1634 family transposase, partial [Firmicutes bacterium]|nr:IS1634 family transposase [Bacillota bacterium]
MADGVEGYGMPSDGDDLIALLGALDRVDSHEVGIGVVVREMLQRMQFIETIDEAVMWDPRQCRLSPGQRLLALVVAIIDNRRALYRLPLFFATRDAELLLGRPASPEALNDKAIARALDKLAAAEPKRVYASLCLRAIEAYHLVVERLHTDTTSVSLYGTDYGDDPEVAIARGFSKDRKPELLQFKIGSAVTQDGVPLFGHVVSGNETDNAWQREALTWAKNLVDEKARGEILYCADSSLVTKDNLDHMADLGYRFVSRLPATFGLLEELKEQALSAPTSDWQEVGDVAQVKRKTARTAYRIWETQGAIEGRGYRFLVVHSSWLEAQKRKTLERRADKEREEFSGRSRELRAREFACERDAHTAGEAFLQKEGPRYWEATVRVSAVEVVHKRPRRGRPAKGDPPPERRTVYKASVELGARREERIEAELAREALFVLITNDTRRDARALLKAYRGQQGVENEFRWLKAPMHVSPIFLKRTERVTAFGYVALIAYLVYALIQHAVRAAMEPGEKLEVEGRKTDRPTGTAVLDMLRHIRVVHLHLKNGMRRRILQTI